MLVLLYRYIWSFGGFRNSKQLTAGRELPSARNMVSSFEQKTNKIRLASLRARRGKWHEK